MVSSAYHTSSPLPTTPKIGHYEDAVLLSKIPLGTLLEILKIPPDADTSNVPALLLAVTGWDITRPPPDHHGKVVFSRSSLKKMKKDQLQLLHREIGNIPHRQTTNREVLEAEILEHHPEAKKQRTDGDYSDQYVSLLGIPEPSSALTTFYGENFNAIDNSTSYDIVLWRQGT